MLKDSVPSNSPAAQDWEVRGEFFGSAGAYNLSDSNPSWLMKQVRLHVPILAPCCENCLTYALHVRRCVPGGVVIDCRSAAVQLAHQWHHFELKASRANWIGFWATRDVGDDEIDVVFAWRGTMVSTCSADRRQMSHVC